MMLAVSAFSLKQPPRGERQGVRQATCGIGKHREMCVFVGLCACHGLWFCAVLISGVVVH